MLQAISPYAGFTAAGLVLVILAVDRHLRASRSRAIAVPVRAVRWPEAEVTQRLSVVVLAPSVAIQATPPLPPAAFRRQAVTPQPPQRPLCRRPDRPADPRSEARLMTPWGELTQLPGSHEPGIVPSTLAAVPAALGYLPAR